MSLINVIEGRCKDGGALYFGNWSWPGVVIGHLQHFPTQVVPWVVVCDYGSEDHVISGGSRIKGIILDGSKG